MSSRKGLVVNADEVYEKLVNYESDEIKKSIKDIVDVEGSIQKVALAAFRYGMLKVDPKQDIIFDYETVTKFDGNSGPYLMYSFARAKSVLYRINYVFSKGTSIYNVANFDFSEANESELALLRTLYLYPEIVFLAADRLSPSVICNYLFDLAHKFNHFYSESSVLKSEGALKNFRLDLCVGFCNIMKSGLFLLGISTVDKM
jgi:arginyl-tRNA synthetase